MNKDLLIVVDMQNVYMKGMPWECIHVPETVNNIIKLIDSGIPGQVIFTKFEAPAAPEGTWKDYNRENAGINSDVKLNEIIKELAPYAGRYPVYLKSTYTSCSAPEVVRAAKAADRVLVTGVVAECCVLATVESLIDLGVKVLYMKDAVSGQSEEFEQIVEKIVESFSTIHTEMWTTEEYLTASSGFPKDD